MLVAEREGKVKKENHRTNAAYVKHASSNDLATSATKR
jgi:hypothetical protein